MDRPDFKSFKTVTFVLISNVRFLVQGDEHAGDNESIFRFDIFNKIFIKILIK